MLKFISNFFYLANGIADDKFEIGVIFVLGLCVQVPFFNFANSVVRVVLLFWRITIVKAVIAELPPSQMWSYVCITHHFQFWYCYCDSIFQLLEHCYKNKA
jgi:hypothetical protein